MQFKLPAIHACWRANVNDINVAFTALLCCHIVEVWNELAAALHALLNTAQMPSQLLNILMQQYIFNKILLNTNNSCTIILNNLFQ